MRKPKYQYFTLEEYQQRMDALRKRMADKGVDAMLVTTPENLYYLTGYQTPGYYWFQTLIVLMDREPVFITRLIESSNIEPLSWVEDSRPYEDVDDWIAKTRDTLVSLGLERKRIGLENDSWFLTSRDYVRLTGMMPNAKFVDCSGLVEQGRMIKSPQEIAYMREAARAAEAGIRAGVEASVVGATENEVAAEIHRAQILAGSEYTGLPIFIFSGHREVLTHGTWSRKRLEPNDSVCIEMPGCINRYHAARWAQVRLGEPPPALLKAMEAGQKALTNAKSVIKAGVLTGDVFKVADDTLFEVAGVRRQSRLAYSIGIAYAPDWGEGHIISIMKGEKKVLQAGMTFHVLTSVRTTPVAARFHCSDTILVTEKGCETLTDGLEQKLWVK